MSAYTDQQLAQDAKDLEIADLKRRLEQVGHRRRRQVDITAKGGAGETIWVILGGLVLWLIFSKGISW